MVNIPIGTRNEQKLLVTGEVAVSFMSDESARVLGTPHMIGWMEMTSRNGILPLLEPGYDSVGTIVDIRHLAATPIGMHVTFISEVVGVEDRRVTFKVEAYDEAEKIGEGIHERFVVNVARFGQRVQAKLAR